MKKGLVFLATVGAFTLGLASCAPASSGGGEKKYTVTITNKDALAEIWDDDLTKSVSVTISDVIVADAYAAGDLVVTSEDESVLKITGNNKIKPVAAGETTVKATYKNKFSDSVSIKINARPALRPATSLNETDEYFLATPLASGKVYSQAEMATGGARFYISGTENMDEAATAKVSLSAEPDGDYKYKITLSQTKGETTLTKVLGVGSNYDEGRSQWHYNLGFEGEEIPDDTGIFYQEAKFKFTSDYHLEVKVPYGEGQVETLLVGTQSGKTTMSLGDTSKVTPAYLYVMGDPIPATAIALDKQELTLAPGETGQLTATLTPETSSDVVTWASQNKQIAEVDQTGLVTAVGNGTTKIVATARDGVSAECTVTVEGEALDFGTLTDPLTPEEAVALLDKIGDNTLSAKKMFVRGVVSESAALSSGRRNIWISNTDGSTAKYFEFYSCQNAALPDLPTDKDALAGYTVTATGWGMKYVSNSTTYELSNKDAAGNYDNPEIVVADQPALTGISLNKETATVTVGESTTLTVVPVPGGAALDASKVTWASDHPEFATVEAGVVNGVAAGEAKITASYKVDDETTYTAECTVTVSAGADTRWDSDLDVITVDEALALDPGTGKTTDDMYYVIGKVSEITNTRFGNGSLVSKDESKTIGIYGMYDITGATRYDAMGDNAPVADDVIVLYSAINNFNGTVQLKNARLAQLNGTSLIPELTGIELNKSTAEVNVGSQVTLTVSPAPAGALFDASKVTWASDHPEFATVEAGVVAGVAAGEAKITASYKVDDETTLTAECTVTVSEDEGGGGEATVLTLTAGTQGSAAKVIVGETENDAIKVGTGNKTGDMTISGIPETATKVTFHGAAWNNKSAVLTVTATNATVDLSSVSLKADSGISNNSPFTLAGNEDDYVVVLTLSNITGEVTITLATTDTANGRFVVWGATAE